MLVCCDVRCGVCPIYCAIRQSIRYYDVSLLLNLIGIPSPRAQHNSYFDNSIQLRRVRLPIADNTNKTLWRQKDKLTVITH